MSRRDIIRWTIDWLLASEEGLTQELLARYEREARQEWGGVVNEPWKTPRGRGGRPPAPVEPASIKADYLAQQPVDEIMSRYRISRATLYRNLKR